MLGYVLIREVLRLANACAGQPLFTCRVRTVTGAPVMGCDGTEIRADENDWEGAQGFDLIMLCAGPDPLEHLPMGLRGFLARGAAAGACLAGLDRGALILAKLGFLAGREAVLPQDLDPDLRARHADIALSARTHVFDRARLTSAGGVASGEALLDWIARVHGAALAGQTAEALAHGRLKQHAMRQGLPQTEDPLLARMITVMLAHLADPLPLTRIAAELELSGKQLRLRCRKGMGLTPADTYLALRLDRARHLVRDTRCPVSEIATATGFESASAFTRSYRRHFGAPPRAERAELRQSRPPGKASASGGHKAPAPADISWQSAHAAAQPTVTAAMAARMADDARSA